MARIVTYCGGTVIVRAAYFYNPSRCDHVKLGEAYFAADFFMPTDRKALIFIFITLLIDSIGFGIILPVMPALISELTGEGVAEAARYGGWLYFLYAATTFFCGPIIGGASDRFGRRPVLLAAMFALGIDYIVMGFAPTIMWLFIGRFIAGIAGATYAPAYALIADITPPDKRAQSFGLLGAAFGAGFVIGPAIGGLLGEFGPRVPFFAAAALALLNFAFGSMVLRETLKAENRRAFDWRRANPVGTLLQLKNYPAILPLLAVLFLWQVAHQVLPATWAYFTQIKFQWSSSMIGASLAVSGIVMIVSQGGLTGILVKRFGGERRAIKIGMTAGLCMYLAYAFAPQGWMLFAISATYLSAGLVWPSLNAMLSQQVPPNAQGELQGGLTCLGSLAAILSPPLMTQLLAYTSTPDRYFPGSPFVLAAMLVMVGLILLSSPKRSYVTT
jgi:DHA1 family tetracycline resistance protein-like MFS transporter